MSYPKIHEKIEKSLVWYSEASRKLRDKVPTLLCCNGIMGICEKDIVIIAKLQRQLCPLTRVPLSGSYSTGFLFSLMSYPTNNPTNFVAYHIL